MVAGPLALELALMGFLRERSMYPYEIFQVLAQRRALGRVWHLKQSQLYALLDRLEEAGYIATETELHGNRPPRKVMSLTASGRAAFDEWLLTPVAHGRDFRIEFLAKLYFASQSGAAAVRRLIADQGAECRAWIQSLTAQAEALRDRGPYDWLVIQFRIRQIEGILSWLDLCVETLLPGN